MSRGLDRSERWGIVGLEARIERLEEQLGQGQLFDGVDMKRITEEVFGNPEQRPISPGVQRASLYVIGVELARVVEDPIRSRQPSTLETLAVLGLPDNASPEMVASRVEEVAIGAGFSGAELMLLRRGLDLTVSRSG